MVSTDTHSRARSAEARGKFITRLPAPRTPRPTGNHTPTPNLPIVPAWLGWR
jgi:hypothetical protein